MSKLLDQAVNHYHKCNAPANMILAQVPEWKGKNDSVPKIKFRTKLSVSDIEYLGSKHNLGAEYLEASISSITFILDVFMLTACHMDGTLVVPEDAKERFAGEVDGLLCAAIITRCGAFAAILESAKGHEDDSLGKPSAS